MAHIHDVFDAEPRYVIDSVTRAIVNKENSKEVIVQGDHNSERFAFEIPRYIDAHDMSLCNRVQVHFINIGPNTARVADVYPIDDLQIDPENTEQVICSWLISSRATTHAGSLNFILRFMCVNDEGKVEYSWSTTPYTNVIISSSIINSSEVVDHYASDILESWYNQLINSGAEGVNVVEATKQNAIDEFNRHAAETRDGVANAFKKTVSGDIVHMEDVSILPHYVKVRAIGDNPTNAVVTVCGKNLFNPAIALENLNEFRSWGTKFISFTETRKIFKPGKTYSISFEAEGLYNYEFTDLYSANIGLTLYSGVDGYAMIPLCIKQSSDENDWLRTGDKIQFRNTITIPESIADKDANYRVFCYTQRAKDSNGEYFLNTMRFNYIQIELADSVSDYEPYEENVYQPSDDGSVDGIVSISPIMNILVDNDLTLEAEYNRDTNAVMGDVEEALDRIVAIQESLLGGVT